MGNSRTLGQWPGQGRLVSRRVHLPPGLLWHASRTGSSDARDSQAEDLFPLDFQLARSCHLECRCFPHCLNPLKCHFGNDHPVAELFFFKDKLALLTLICCWPGIPKFGPCSRTRRTMTNKPAWETSTLISCIVQLFITSTCTITMPMLLIFLRLKNTIIGGIQTQGTLHIFIYFFKFFSPRQLSKCCFLITNSHHILQLQR